MKMLTSANINYVKKNKHSFSFSKKIYKKLFKLNKIKCKTISKDLYIIYIIS